MTNLTIYDEKLTRIKDVGGVNMVLTRPHPLLLEEHISGGLFKIIPLFYYDSVSVDSGILENKGDFFVTDQEKFYFTSNVSVNRSIFVLTVSNFNNNVLLWVTDLKGNPFNNAFIEVYGCDDGENFELIGNGRTDSAGQFIYESEVEYIKFLYDGVFSDVVGL